MKISNTSLSGVLIIEPRVFHDERGYFFESFNEKNFKENIDPNVTFKQDNQSRSSKGVLRGLHYQEAPFAQGNWLDALQGRFLM
jgi:dTDP-4-dehydrorhamnose 3,5-epimerase